MPRINQLPAASSVAQTDVLAIDTPDKTYQVPRSVLAPAPFQATIQPGYWSGSGSDYYFTVSASNVTTSAQLYPFYDKASDAMLNGPVWVIPADGSFTIHTSAIPSGTVTISVLLAGIVGEAQYQVLADVYSKSQVDTIVSQSTAIGVWNQRAVEWASSTVSFTDAIIKLGYTAASYIATSLENIVSQKISGISNESVSGGQVVSGGPYYGYMIYKYNNSYYAGILFSYYSDQYVAFRYLNGTYKVKLI